MAAAAVIPEGEGTSEEEELPHTIPDLENYDPDTDCWGYGLDERSATPLLEAEFEAITEWCQKPINLRRGEEYAGAAKDATMSSMLACIKGFLGYSIGYAGRPRSDLSIRLYTEPKHFVTFLAYLQARELSGPTLLKHLAVAKKVVFYLRSSMMQTSKAALSLTRIRTWMGALEAQIQRTMPGARPKVLPEFSKVLAWVDWLSTEAQTQVDADMSSLKYISLKGAELLQQAILAHLVTGASFPTVRLDLIRNLRHPDRSACDDVNCTERGSGCKGNHLEIEADGAEDAGAGAGEAWYEEEFGSGTISLHIVHGKNDRRKSRAAYKVSFNIPEGQLTQMLRAHIRQGIHVLTRGIPPTKLFVRPTGRPFDKSSLSTYWTAAIMGTAGRFQLGKMPPSHFRTLFVENFTCTEGGVPEELWEGAAIVMGNSTATWRTNYWPSMRKRKAQLVVREYHSFTDKHRAGQVGKEKEEEEIPGSDSDE